MTTPIKKMIQTEVYRLYAPKCLELCKEELVGSPNKLLYKTLYTAISPGTEMAAYMGEPALREGAQYPRVQGYCSVGQIIGKFGSDGELMSGDMEGMIVVTHQSHRSYAVIDREDILAISARVDLAKEMSLAYVYHLGLSAQLRLELMWGDSVFVYGSGIIAQAALELFSSQGIRCYGVTDCPERKELLLASGAERAMGSAEASEMSGSADKCIIFNNSWRSWFSALNAVRCYGKIGVLGFPGRSEALQYGRNPLDPVLTYAKQLQVDFCGLIARRPDERKTLDHTELDNMSRLASLIEDGRLVPNRLVSGEVEYTELEQAYELLRLKTPKYNTLVLDWK